MDQRLRASDLKPDMSKTERLPRTGDDGRYCQHGRSGPTETELFRTNDPQGTGQATAAKMQRLGTETGADLKAKPLSFL